MEENTRDGKSTPPIDTTRRHSRAHNGGTVKGGQNETWLTH